MNDKRRMPDAFACDKLFCTKGGNEFYENKLYKNSDTGDRPNNKKKTKSKLSLKWHGVKVGPGPQDPGIPHKV